MKRLFLLAVAMTIASMSIAAEGKHLSALFSYATFYQSGTGSYVETYLSFDAWNLNFVQSFFFYMEIFNKPFGFS